MPSILKERREIHKHKTRKYLSCNSSGEKHLRTIQHQMAACTEKYFCCCCFLLKSLCHKGGTLEQKDQVKASSAVRETFCSALGIQEDSAPFRKGIPNKVFYWTFIILLQRQNVIYTRQHVDQISDVVKKCTFLLSHMASSYNNANAEVPRSQSLVEN